MEDEQAHVISVAKIINTKMNDSISRMEAIMNSSDAQELQADDQSYLTAILRGNKISPQDKAVIEAERQRLQARRSFSGSGTKPLKRSAWRSRPS